MAKAPLVLHGWFVQRATPAAARGVTAFLSEALALLPPGMNVHCVRAPDSGFFEEVLLAFLEPAAVALPGGGAPDEAAQTPGRGHQTNTASGYRKRLEKTRSRQSQSRKSRGTKTSRNANPARSRSRNLLLIPLDYFAVPDLPHFAV